MGTATPSSPADGALRRAAAFLRVVQPGSGAAVAGRSAMPSRSAGGPIESGDERQMLLPHVALDAPAAEAGQAPTAEPSTGAGAESVEKTIWGSPAGKKPLAPRLVKLIPPHKTYVEPF